MDAKHWVFALIGGTHAASAANMWAYLNSKYAAF